ncbi:MAG: sugar transporter permease [Cyclobacteriaceae bacterium]|nr:MAG: sugar transporter permease [Cyclobacteriaceae bacterium]
MSTLPLNISRKAAEHSTLLLLILVVVLFGSLGEGFLTMRNFVNILIQVSGLTIVAAGMTLVLITAGIDLSVGSIMFLAGVVSGKLVDGGLSIWLAMPAILLVGAGMGFVNGLSIVRFRIIPFIVTLATLYMGRGLGLYISETRAVNLPDSFLAIGSLKIMGIPLPVIIMVAVLLVLHLLLTRTPFGRQLYAIGNSRVKSEKAGIRVSSLLLKVYVISGLCAAIGGFVAIAQLGAVSPSFGSQSEFTAIAAAVLGGTSLFGGRGAVFPGTFIGALLIQTIQNGLVIINADPYLYPLITASLIFFIVLIDSRHR